jgi:NtrC-family two-component system sensor histidine kinase KinB
MFLFSNGLTLASMLGCLGLGERCAIMTLKKKILIGYGLSFAFMGFVVALAVINLVALGKATDAILSENYRSILAAENMVDALERQDSGTLLVLMGEVEEGATLIQKNEAIFLEWLGRAKDNVTISGENDLLSAIGDDYATYRRVTENLATLPQNFARQGYRDRIFPMFMKVRDACISLRNINEETMYTASEDAKKVAHNAIWSTMLVASSALVVALIFSMILAERIVQPIRRFMEASRHISAGDYDIQVPVGGTDELSRLANEFNQMATQVGRYNAMNIERVIAEKNKSEAVLESIEDGLVIFDLELKVAGINPAGWRIFDLPPVEDPGLLCADIIPDSRLCDLIRGTVETGRPPIMPDEQRVVCFQHVQGVAHYLFSITVIRGIERDLSGIVLLLKDITRLKQVEQLKSDFVMAASHELRTPLTSLGMSVDLLLEHAAHNLAEKERELLLAAHEEVHRMKSLVGELLDLSRIEAGRIEMEFENVPVATFFEHMQTVFKSQMELKEVGFAAEVQGDLPLVRADANKIAWVLSNLISNALRYVNRGGHVMLRAQQAGAHVQLSVRDDGMGIPEEYQTRIFHKFVQVKGQEAGGSGLGLAICKEIVRAHGGTIWVESIPGKGSTFTFTLPAVGMENL